MGGDDARQLPPELLTEFDTGHFTSVEDPSALARVVPGS
jgi:hypothetical protein